MIDSKSNTNFKKQFISGVSYVAITKYSGILIQLVITAILSRLLSPDDFGLIAITSVFIVFFSLISNMGISPAIIQNKTLTKKDIEVIFTFTIYVGFVLSMVFFLFAPIISNFYNNSTLLTMCRWLSFSVFFSCLGIVPGALLLKEKNFKRLLLVELFALTASGSLGIIFAFSGLGVFSLLIYSISSLILIFFMNYLHNPIKLSTLKIESLKKIAVFSSYQYLFNIINYFSRNLDNLLIGKYFSPAILGYYEKSYRLMLMPVQNLTHVFTSAIQPYFSDFQDEKKRIFQSYIKIAKLLALIGFPLSVFLYFSAKEIILIIFGDQWTESIPIFEILSWSVGIQMVISSSGAIFQAANNTRQLFFSGLASMVLMITAICLGVFYFKDLMTVVYLITLSFYLNFFICYYFLILKTLGQSFKEFLRITYLPLLVAVLTFVTEYIVSLHISGWNIYLALFIKVALFVMILSPFCFRMLKKLKYEQRS